MARREICYEEEINQDTLSPGCLLSSLKIMVQLTARIIADQFHLINNLKQLPRIPFDLHWDQLPTRTTPKTLKGSFKISSMEKERGSGGWTFPRVPSPESPSLMGFI